MAVARAPPRWATTRRRPGACRRSATAPARRASSPTATSSAAVAVARRAIADVSFLQEGAVGRRAPYGAHRVHELRKHEDHDPHLVARVDDLPRDGRPHDRRPRRAQARPRVRLRGHGRAQARRVRPHAHVSRACRHGEAPMSETPRDRETDPTEVEEVLETTDASEATAG